MTEYLSLLNTQKMMKKMRSGDMKNWRDNYIKVAKGGRPVWKWTNTLLKWDHFCDDKPVFVEKNSGKKK